MTSWNNNEALSFSADAPLFKLTFKATSKLELSDVIAISNQHISAEAYNAELKFLTVDLRFEKIANEAVSNNGYVLPNAWHAHHRSYVCGLLPTIYSYLYGT